MRTPGDHDEFTALAQHRTGALGERTAGYAIGGRQLTADPASDVSASPSRLATRVGDIRCRRRGVAPGTQPRVAVTVAVIRRRRT